MKPHVLRQSLRDRWNDALVDLKWMACAAAAAGLLLIAGTPGSAQVMMSDHGHTPGISVYGNGEMVAKPNLVEISLRATAAAELTADAIVKYRDTKRRTLEAFEKLNLGKLDVQELGVSLTDQTSAEQMQNMWRGMGNVTNGKTKVEISSALQLRLSGIRDLSAEQVMETVGKLLDTAKDSGASIGPTAAEMNMAWRYGQQANSTLVRFILTDLNQMREEAYQNAVNDARTRAERLAKLNGVKLGGVLGVQEISVSGDDQQTTTTPWGQVIPSGKSKNREPEVSSEQFTEIPFHVKLQVRFAIEPGEAKTARN
ncbi:MAG TPA: SIMPL domain-containing protein [Pirellulales bacterium]|nr:SIMPL domain-containing protein [Pirellulales bacterium]